MTLDWVSDERCILGDVTFQTLGTGLFDRESPAIALEGADFLLFKERPLIEEYVELVEELEPRHIVELGVLEGGSTAFLSELARPRRLVAIDQKPPTVSALADYIADKGLAEAVRVYDDVNQADRPRLAEIVRDAFGDDPLELVVDDCSHFYEPTRASFNELFPRLRPGGLYVIEDWPWAHSSLADLWPDETPLTRLIFELQLAIPAFPGLIAEVAVRPDSAQIRRGDATVDPREFEVSEWTDPAGRGLLADG